LRHDSFADADAALVQDALVVVDLDPEGKTTKFLELAANAWSAAFQA
jgi:hypothetical protein